MTIAATVAVSSGAAYAGYVAYGAYQLEQAITRIPISRPATESVSQTTTTAYQGPTQPVTFLLLGFDSRDGRNEEFLTPGKRSGQGGGGADSIILIRIDPIAKRTEVLSIHRDLRVRIPGCGIEKINASLVCGGDPTPDGAPNPSIAVQVVEAVTGVHIDHVGMVDFAGFRNIVDAVGGVDICLETAEKDRYTGLDLPAGCQHVGGEQALAYARSRHTKLLVDEKWVPDMHDDFSRIKRQQAFLRALANRLSSPSVLGNLSALAEAAKGNIYVDDTLDISSTLALARHMAGTLDSVATAALPVYNMNMKGISYVGLDKARAEALVQSFLAGTMTSQEVAESYPEGGRDSSFIPGPPTSGDSDSGTKRRSYASEE